MCVVAVCAVYVAGIADLATYIVPAGATSQTYTGVTQQIPWAPDPSGSECYQATPVPVTDGVVYLIQPAQRPRAVAFSSCVSDPSGVYAFAMTGASIYPGWFRPMSPCHVTDANMSAVVLLDHVQVVGISRK